MSATPPPIPYASPSAAGATPQGASPLTPEHLAQLASAQSLYRPIARAKRYATFEAWSLLIFGVITFVTGITSPTAIFIGLALCFTGFFELKTAKRLAQADPDAPKLLALNQGVLALCLIIYSSIRLIQIHLHPVSIASEDPALAGVGDFKEVDDLSNMVMNLLYYGLIFIAIFVQGLTGLFYYSRRKHVAAYRAQVPEWAQTLAQQAATR